ncbi:MAG: 4Fe-4S binding protein [Candidatus Neomarinimicrobiota bacterium]
MAKTPIYDHYKSVPEPIEKVNRKKKRPRKIAVVDEDNCTGCQVCIPFCPVDCIEAVPAAHYQIPVPPVQIRFNECIGCQICAKVCTKLTWDAIQMLETSKFESIYSIDITG